MAIAFGGVALLTGLTLGFKRIEKPRREADAAMNVLKKTEEQNVSEVQDQKIEENKTPGA